MKIELLKDLGFQKQYRITGIPEKTEWGTEEAYCDFTLWNDSDNLGSFGGSAWPAAWPSVFESLPKSLANGGAGVKIRNREILQK